MEQQLVAMDGSIVEVESCGGRIRYSGRDAVQVVIRDISERKRAEQAMLAAKREAEAANLAKSAFLATMSHEIRTPLNSILGINEVILEGDLDVEQRNYLNIVSQAGKSLLAIISNVLDISKIEAGEMDLESIPVNLRDCIREAMAIVRPQIGGKDLHLVMEVEPDVPAWVMGDPGRLRQILLNLIGNAVKFTEQGSIGVHLRRHPHGVRFSVHDSGIGIPPDKLESIFSSFFQADASNTRRYGGAGLGLTICRRLVEQMNGTIKVNSLPEEGTSFIFTLPLRQVDAPEANALFKEGSTLKQPFTPPASSDQDQVDMLPENIPDRRGPQRRRMKDRRSRTRRIGERRLQTLRTTDTAMAPTREISPATYRILVVEDSPDNQQLIRAYLKKRPYELVMAENGAEALARFEQERFHIVLMDLQMPVMDGYEATRRIRQLEAQHLKRTPTPIIVLTAHATREVSHSARQAGCNFYLTKPISKGRLMETLENYLPQT